MSFRNLFLILLLLILIVCIPACGGGGGSKSEEAEPSSNTTKVRINLSGPSSAQRSATAVGEVPSTVYFIDVEVKAGDMATIVQGIYDKCGAEITEDAVIEVRNGNDRIFIVRAYDDSACIDSGTIVYSAKSDPIDLNGGEVDLALTMHTVNYQTEAAKDAFTNGDYSAANEKFKELVEVDPTNQEANAFYAATRLYQVFGFSPQEFRETAVSSTTRIALADAGATVKEVLENFGFIEEYWQDFMALHGDFPKTDGVPDLPANSPTTAEVINSIVDYLLPQINGAINNLEKVTDEAFSTTVTFSSTIGGDNITYTADYGDVLFFKAMLYGVKAFINLLLAYDLDNVDIDDVQYKLEKGLHDPPKNILNVQQELDNNYLNFGKLIDVSKLSVAKANLQKAIDAYQAASAWIRDDSKRDGGTAYIVEFTDDPNREFKDRQDENRFRVILAKVENALTETTVFGRVRPEELDSAYRSGYAYDYFRDPRSDFKMNLKNFFETVDFRDKAPQFEYDEDSGDNDAVRGTFPDPTLGDIFPTLTQYDLTGLFDLYPEPVISPFLWKDTTSGGEGTLYGAVINGVSPADLFGGEIYSSDSSIWRWISNLDPILVYGNHVYFSYDGSVFPQGDYFGILHLEDQRIPFGPKNFIPDNLPPIDESTMMVCQDGGGCMDYQSQNVVYIETPTPTFKWGQVSPDPGYFYRIAINSWAENDHIYVSPRMRYEDYQNGVTIPADILYPNSSFKWRVEMFDAESSIEISNRYRTAWKSFYTGMEESSVSEEWREVRIARGFNRFDMDYGFRRIGKSIDDMSDADRTITFDIDGNQFQRIFDRYNNSNMVKFWGDTSDTSGYWTYFFGGELLPAEVSLNPAEEMGEFEEASVSPRHNAYVETLTPTFAWDKLPDDTGDYEYRILVSLYSRAGFRSIIYVSPRGSTANQVTIPGGILQWDRTYVWFVRAYYQPDDGRSLRVSETVRRLFTTIRP